VRIAGGTVDIGAYESDIAPPLENARAYKQRALMTISACLESSDSSNSYYLNKAADRISASLESWLWIDGDRLSHYGVFVFIREQQAVWYLKRVNGSCAAAAQAAMNDLVYADEKIAAAALNAASACNGSHYNQAANAYAHGVAASAAGDEYAAISWYGWTWWFANNALGKPCHYDDDDEDYCYHSYNN
jgi:hypothetical protein